MPISVVCACGKTASVPESMAGKKGKCPACGTIMAIPAPDEPVDDAEDVDPVPLPPRSRATQTPGTPTAAPAASPPGRKVRARCQCGAKFFFDPTKDHALLKCPGCNGSLDRPDVYLIYSNTIQKVHLIDAEMPFGSMCWLVFKWTCATIPTVIVVGLVIGVLMALNQGSR